MYTYLSDFQQGRTQRGSTMAGYIGGCGVNNTSCCSYVGDSPVARARAALEREQVSTLLLYDSIHKIDVNSFFTKLQKYPPEDK